MGNRVKEQGQIQGKQTRKRGKDQGHKEQRRGTGVETRNRDRHNERRQGTGTRYRDEDPRTQTGDKLLRPETLLPYSSWIRHPDAVISPDHAAGHGKQRTTNSENNTLSEHIKSE